jgi:hypothetical protein
MTGNPPTFCRTPRSLLKPLAVVAGVGLFLFGLLTLGRVALEQVRGSDRYAVSFSAIECTPPTGQARGDFLDEVQYLAGMPDRFGLLDDELAPRLAEAFARHPCVEKVLRVELAPPRQVRVRLRYRTPMLAVPVAGRTRVVDGHGVLLPAATSARGLPVFEGPIPAPGQPEGRPWGDPAVSAASRTAAFLRPYQQRLRLTRVESDITGLVWGTAAGTRVLWGHPAGGAAVGEAPAAEKRRRLLGYCDEHGGLDRPTGPYEHDVRPPEQAIHRPLPSGRGG